MDVLVFVDNPAFQGRRVETFRVKNEGGLGFEFEFGFGLGLGSDASTTAVCKMETGLYMGLYTHVETGLYMGLYTHVPHGVIHTRATWGYTHTCHMDCG